MATSTVSLDQAQDSAKPNDVIAVTSESVTYVVTRKPAPEATETNPDPKPGPLGFSALDETKTDKGEFKSQVAKDIEAGKLEALHRVVVSFPVVHSLSGISELVPEEEEAVAIFNKGLNQKVGLKLRSYFTEVDEKGELVHTSEDTFDAAEIAAEPMQRRAMSDVQKAVKTLKGLSPEAVRAALAEALGITF